MWSSSKAQRVIAWIGWISLFIGAIDLPDQVQRWIKFGASVFEVAVNWDVSLLNEGGRWAFCLVGLVLIFCSTDTAKKLWQNQFLKRATNQHEEKKMVAHPAPFVDAPPPKPLPSTSLFGSGVTCQPSERNGALVLRLINARNREPLRDCRVFIENFKIWSVDQKAFVLIKEFDKQVGLRPMMIHGPDDLYVDQPVVCTFIEAIQDKLVVRHVQIKSPAIYTQLPQVAGIWCAFLRLEFSQTAYLHRVCFEWLPGKHVAFVKCPDYSMADFL